MFDSRKDVERYREVHGFDNNDLNDYDDEKIYRVYTMLDEVGDSFNVKISQFDVPLNVSKEMDECEIVEREIRFDDRVYIKYKGERVYILRLEDDGNREYQYHTFSNLNKELFGLVSEEFDLRGGD